MEFYSSVQFYLKDSAPLFKNNMNKTVMLVEESSGHQTEIQNCGRANH